VNRAQQIEQTGEGYLDWAGDKFWKGLHYVGRATGTDGAITFAQHGSDFASTSAKYAIRTGFQFDRDAAAVPDGLLNLGVHLWEDPMGTVQQAMMPFGKFFDNYLLNATVGSDSKALASWGNQQVSDFNTAWNTGKMPEYVGDKLFVVANVALALAPGGEEVEAASMAGDLRFAAPATDSFDYGVTFFNKDVSDFYMRENPTLGPAGKSLFMMPLEDSAVVTDAATAVRYTGAAPSTLKAYLTDGDIYGISFPTEGMELRVPTAADAGGYEHFLEGGHTAVRFNDGFLGSGGYLVNDTREFVTGGGAAVPSGSTLFKLGPSGEWIPIRRF
jgi:hypothetical protein